MPDADVAEPTGPYEQQQPLLVARRSSLPQEPSVQQGAAVVVEQGPSRGRPLPFGLPATLLASLEIG